MRVYVPLAKPTYLAYGLVSVSYHWNNFLWPLVITNSVETRPLTVGLAIFGAPESGVNWSIISAGTLLICFSVATRIHSFSKTIHTIVYVCGNQIICGEYRERSEPKFSIQVTASFTSRHNPHSFPERWAFQYNEPSTPVFWSYSYSANAIIWMSKDRCWLRGLALEKKIL